MYKNKSDVLNAAIEYVRVASKDPLWGLGVDHIAKDIGVSRCRLYRVIVGGVEGIAAALIESELSKLSNHLTFIPNGHTDKIVGLVRITLRECNANIVSTAASIIPDFYDRVYLVLRKKFTADCARQILDLASVE